MVRVPIKIFFVGADLTECMLVGAFSCIKKLISGKRKSVSQLLSMKTGEQCER